MKIACIIFLFLVTGCAGSNPNQYSQAVEATWQANAQALEFRKHLVNELVRLEQAKISADKEVELAKIESRKPVDNGNGDTSGVWTDGVVDIDASHCERYRDDKDYDERFGQCLQDEILSYQNKRRLRSSDPGNPQSTSVSGDNNIVISGSPGAEVIRPAGMKEEKGSSVSAALTGMLKETTFSPLPPYQEQQHPVAQGIDAATGMVSELAPTALKMLIGWKGLDVLGDAIAKDSTAIDGGIVSNSNNPISTKTTTTTNAPAE
jgi:hypothetical protein